MKKASTEYIYKLFLQCPIISKDTRNIPKNCIYFALKGDNFNGNDFATEAIEKGARYSIVDEMRSNHNEKCILVDDCLKTLQDLAIIHRSTLKIPVIGITGSNGKTTTKELIREVISKKYNTLSTSGNFNNHIGVPLTILSIQKEHEFAIIEMGANHVGEIEFLCRIAKPNYGLITNIGKAHLEGFGGIEGVKKGKSELYRFIESTDGFIFINNDDSILLSLCKSDKVFSYGISKGANLNGVLEKSEPNLEGSWKTNLNSGSFKSQLFGRYNFDNILAAIAVGNFFDVAPKEIDEAIERYKAEMNRSQLVKKENYQILLDAYNANPSSMKVAFENFEKFPAQNKMIVFGDMFELGSDSDLEHKKLVEVVLNSKDINGGIFVGKNFFKQKREHDKFHFFETRELASQFFKHFNKEKITFLIKGSRGMALEKMID
mgnify:CR=1 FL=1|tara:strand:- start:32 stop:1330 length:1299 start_codon:yes stop_codon:yes gene_type:complete